MIRIHSMIKHIMPFLIPITFKGNHWGYKVILREIPIGKDLVFVCLLPFLLDYPYFTTGTFHY